jgi:ABC-2 type transport system ATP-binding protein
MIELRDFTKIYQTGIFRKSFYTAVDSFSMTCDEGMVTGLLGPNGAGKTTILKAVCGYHFPTSGTILVEGHSTQDDPVLIKNITGFVEEQPHLPPEYTVFEFLSFAAEMHGITGRYRADAIERVVFDCALKPVIGRKNHALSKGFRQRVAFAKALIHNPQVLVLDEPINGLDPAQIVHMRDLIKQLAKGRTVLLSTHLMQEVSALCSKIYIISHGCSVCAGSESAIISEAETDTLEEAFLKLTTDGTVCNV